MPSASAPVASTAPTTTRLRTLRVFTATIVALAVSITAVAAPNATVEASSKSGWELQYETYAINTGWLIGGFMKDRAEGKAGPLSSPHIDPKKRTWKMADTKKYAFIAGIGIAVGVAAGTLPNAKGAFQTTMLVELQKVAEQLGGAIMQVESMVDQTGTIMQALDVAELNLQTSIMNSAISPVWTYYFPPGVPNFQMFQSDLITDLQEDEPTIPDDEAWHAEFDDFMRTIQREVGGPTVAMRNTALAFTPFYAGVLADPPAYDAVDETGEGELGTEDQYYTALWSEVLHHEAVSAIGTEMLRERHLYFADIDPDNAPSYASEAETAIAAHLDFRRSLYKAAGQPVGNDAFTVVHDNGAWWLVQTDSTAQNDPRLEWYDGWADGPLGYAAPLADTTVNSAGVPSLHTATWAVSTLGDEDATIEVYRDGTLVDTLSDGGRVTPGPNVAEVTLTDDRDAAAAGTGWWLVAVPSDDGPPLLRWVGDVDVHETTTIDVTAGEWSFLAAEFAHPWSTVEMTVDGPGEIEVWEGGELVTTIEESDINDDAALVPEWMLIANEDAELTLTTDDQVAADPDVPMALLATGEHLVSWGPSLGQGDLVIDVTPGEVVAVDAVYSADAPRPVDLTVDGPGSVDVIRDGRVLDTFDESSSPRSFDVYADDVTVTSVLDDVPSSGWALYAAATTDAEFDGWSGAHSGTATNVVQLTTQATKLDAGFSWVPTTFDLNSSAGGRVERYDDGQLVDSDATGTTFTTDSALTVTADENDVPSSGPALLARPDDTYRFVSWSGAHDGATTTTIEPAPGETLAVGAEFGTATMNIEVGAGGAVEVHRDGILEQTIDATAS
ncbi:MAG: hypothetical protein AAFY28_18380, partial [Actinomycetota bacterium]